MAFKDLAATVFGTTSSAGTSTSTLLVISPEDHPDWQRHQQQRDQLARQLGTAEEDVKRLQRERVQAEHDVREADVLRFLGDNVATMAPDAIAVDAAIATARGRVATIAVALKRLDARGAELRNSLVCEIKAAKEAAARELVKKLAKSLRAAAALNNALSALDRFEQYDIDTAPGRPWYELSPDPDSRLNRWLADAQAAGWDV